MDAFVLHMYYEMNYESLMVLKLYNLLQDLNPLLKLAVVFTSNIIMYSTNVMFL